MKQYSLGRGAIILYCLITVCISLPKTSMATEVNATDKEQTDAMGHGSASDVIVAKVNGTTINMAQLMRTMGEISRTKHGSEEVSQLLAEKIKQEATDQLITEELAVQKATEVIKTVPSEKLEAKIQAVRKKYKTEDDFNTFIVNDFGKIAEFRRQMERFLVLELYILQEFDSKVTVTDQEIEQLYEATKTKRFVTDEFVQVIDLTFFYDPADPESISKIEAIKQTIVDKYNNDPRKLPIDGTFTMEKNIPLNKDKNKALYDAAKKLKEYGWSSPINVDGNLHIVQLVGYKPAFNQSLKEATPLLKNEIKKQKRQAMLNEWMAGLRQGAAIEVMDLTR